MDGPVRLLKIALFCQITVLSVSGSILPNTAAAYDLGICILARDDPVAWNTFSYKFVIWVPPSSSKEKRQGGSSKIHRFTPREILRVTFPDGGMIQLTKSWKKLQFEKTFEKKNIV